MKTIIKTDKAPAPIGPYNQAVIANGVLYVSGQIPLDPATGELVSGSIEEETEMVMKNLQAILEAANTSFDAVIKCSIFISDMGQFGQINAVYGNYFGENAPARECVEVSKLPKGVNVEISCMALVS